MITENKIITINIPIEKFKEYNLLDNDLSEERIIIQKILTKHITFHDFNISFYQIDSNGILARLDVIIRL